jgi:hypothetical protein
VGKNKPFQVIENGDIQKYLDAVEVEAEVEMEADVVLETPVI